MSAEKPITVFQILEKNEFDTGSVHQMFQAAAGFRERGSRVAIISRPGEAMQRRAAEAGIDFHPFPFRNDFDPVTISGIRRLVRQYRPEVIHVHKGRPHTLALAATWTDPVPAFVVNRGVSFPLTIWNRAKYRTSRVDRVVTVCRQIKDVVVESGRLPEDKVSVIYAGTDTDRFDPARWNPTEFRDEKGIPRDAFLITQVGIRDWKGWRELLDAAATLHQSRPKLHVALIGSGSAAQSAEVMEAAAQRGIAGAVTVVEARDDMPRVFAASDLVTDASWAGTGITGTIREAMAMSRPVIATDCGGNRELISSTEVGWMIPAKDHDALTAAIVEVMTDPERSRRVGTKAMEHVRRGFSKTARIAHLDALYRGIVGAKVSGQ